MEAHAFVPCPHGHAPKCCECGELEPSHRRFLVRDESGRGGSVGGRSAADLVEWFGDDWDDAHDVGRAGEDTEPFEDVVGRLEVGGELRIDGATVVVRVS